MQDKIWKIKNQVYFQNKLNGWLLNVKCVKSEFEMDGTPGRSPFATIKNFVALANRGTVSPRRFSMVSWIYFHFIQN